MALGSTHPLTEMSTGNLPAGKGRPACKAKILTAICELKMLEPRRLTTLWASTACYRDSLAYFVGMADINTNKIVFCWCCSVNIRVDVIVIRACSKMREIQETTETCQIMFYINLSSSLSSSSGLSVFRPLVLFPDCHRWSDHLVLDLPTILLSRGIYYIVVLGSLLDAVLYTLALFM
jgi:hypothetical protein